MADTGGRRIEIPGYRDFREIGRGGFAVVYQAEQEILQRHVAVKVITLLDVTDDARRRFRLECTTIGRLAWHPNIVTVFDAGDTPEGWPYLVMEYLPDGSFADRMRAGPLPWDDVVEVGVKIAGALQAAHDEGAIHRDVKPDNILMGRSGEPKLGDFGIATLQDGTKSRTGSLTATLAYAAPEVLSGERASASSDVYSLAATLHAMCAGTAPFLRDSDEHFFALIRRVADEPPADLRPLGVPDAIASAIETGMAKTPDGRPPSAAAFAEVLTAAVLGRMPEVVAAPPPGRSDPTVRESVPVSPPAAAAAGTSSAGEGTVVAAAPQFADGAGSAATGGSSPTQDPGSGSPGSRRLLGVGAAVLLLLALVVGIVVTQSGGDDGDDDTTQPDDDSPTDGDTSPDGSGDEGEEPPDGSGDGSFGIPVVLVPDPLADPEPGQIVTLLGTGTPGDGPDGAVDGTMIDTPRGVVASGTVSISEAGNSRVRILGDGFLTTVAGFPAAGEVAAPTGIDVLGGGIVFADAERHQVIAVDPEGSVAVIAGESAQQGYSGDGGPSAEASLNAPSGVAVGPDGSVYVADSFNHVVRRIDPAGVITTIAGTGEAGYGGDGGPATAAQLSNPRGLAVSTEGVVFVVDGDNAAVRRIDLDGTITTIAGTGQPGFGGDGGPATAAGLDGPHAIALGPDGSLYVADTFNNRIRRIDPSGTITTVAGNGDFGAEGDGGPAVDAQLFNPEGVSVGADGDLYIADTGNHAIRRVGAPS